jgi:hypothetical protein
LNNGLYRISINADNVKTGIEKIAAMNSRAHYSIMERALFSFHHGTPIGLGRLDNGINPLFVQLAVDDFIELPDFLRGQGGSRQTAKI